METHKAEQQSLLLDPVRQEFARLAGRWVSEGKKAAIIRKAIEGDLSELEWWTMLMKRRGDAGRRAMRALRVLLNLDEE